MIDVHGHLSSPDQLARYPMPAALGDAEGMIEAKLAAGVAVTILGSPVGGGAMVPLPGVDNYAQTEDELRRFHDWLRGLVERFPDHLRAYVYVNPFGDDAHLANAAELAADPAFVGIIANSSVNGRHLADPQADSFFAMAAERGLPVLLHAPASPAAGTGLTDLMAIEQLGRFCDVTIAVACCVLGGWLEKYRDLNLIAQGGGGAVGLLAEKLDLGWAAPHWGGADGPFRPLPKLPHPPSSYFERIWADTATPSPRALDLAVATFGAGRMLFGTDSPPLPTPSVGGAVRLVEALPVTAEQRHGIREGNARRLFGPRLPKEQS
ncbi:amidohydrolase family protein [Streptomyces eurythermus]|uniref:amidohydrolase family protein n=1 Tax=Streptomyces eurythermus TaxID=42237 RepID=UPI0036D3C0AC